MVLCICIFKISTRKTVSKCKIYYKNFDILQQMGRQNSMVCIQNEIIVSYT